MPRPVMTTRSFVLQVTGKQAGIDTSHLDKLGFLPFLYDPRHGQIKLRTMRCLGTKSKLTISFDALKRTAVVVALSRSGEGKDEKTTCREVCIGVDDSTPESLKTWLRLFGNKISQGGMGLGSKAHSEIVQVLSCLVERYKTAAKPA